ncbi:MAG: acyl-CoA thioesterase [Pseudoruegeria sp.]
MYPIFRMMKEIVVARRAGPMGPMDVNVTHHRCWPQDIDVFMELNNGRTLTLYDLGRVPMAVRIGFDRVLKKNNWGLTIAGSSVRYRRRVRMFQKFTMKSRLIGWDDKFMYLGQTMWSNGTCTSQALLRAALTNKSGIVKPSEFAGELGLPIESPALPDWVANWVSAEDSRVWPPILSR